MKYFSIRELIKSDIADTHNIDNTPDMESKLNLISLIDNVLDPVREKWESPIIVSSGYRCDKLNSRMKGSKTSQHRFGQAADIRPKNGDVKGLFEMIVSMIKSGELEVGQLIDEYDYSWIHISLPTERLHNEIKKAEKVKGNTVYTLLSF